MASITVADARAAVPETQGEFRVAGLEGKAEIFRDPWGIPHIRARGTADAWFALGFAHAQDRLWQMESTLRRAVGRWAEWAGPSGLPADKLARRLDALGAAKRDFAALPPAARGMLEAYAAGVNACIARGPAPVEYRLLDAAPELWEPWAGIAVMRQRGFLMGSVWFKLWRAAALRAIGPDNIGKLRYDDGGRDLLCMPTGIEAERWVATLADLAPALEAVAALGAADATGGGSNNWALAPKRTASGRPLLAGDPHRTFDIPGMYAQTHVACDAFDVIGLTVPGVPGFPHYGHNGKVAWCVTHAFADIHDLFVERFDAGGERYRFRDEWRAVARREETISVRSAAAARVIVQSTHHGPVIAGDPARGAAVTLQSVQFDAADLSLACMEPMMRAGSVDALFEATRGFGLIDHNLVAADISGRIGHLVRAVVPVRPRSNGWLPVPGWTGAHEWQGAVPFERMPRNIDPPEGVIVTANNRFVADDHADYLTTDCHPPYRARRILERLRALDAATVEDMNALHTDVASVPARELRDRIAKAPHSPLRDLIAGWDCRMERSSTAATAYYAVRRAMTRILAERSGLARAARDPLLAVAPGVAPLNQLWWTLPGLLRRDDSALLGGASWDEAIAAALDEVDGAGAPKPWGEVHRPRFVHPLSTCFPDAAALLDPPAASVAGDGDTVCATGAFCAGGMEAAYGPIARYVIDVGGFDNSLWGVFHGASGHPGSPHYADQVANWAEGRVVPMLYAWPRIEAEAAARLALQP
ncbi:penicillin acylase family protein [Desertibaculum subflavum]|uniref:penicillin acylase family protein n=1 Tax=Desertibaculum subflavum TaxID=2268458 RepID=UPI000E66EFD3